MENIARMVHTSARRISSASLVDMQSRRWKRAFIRIQHDDTLEINF